MEQVTIRDIARKCKVGVSTVSRAMNNHPDINPETKEMILKVIAESNYVPNNSARNLKRSNAKAIAILVKGMDNMFFNNMISVIEEVVRKKKYACIIERVEEKANEVDSAIEIVKEKRLRGIIFLGGRSDYSPEEVSLLGVPYVCCSYTNSYGTLPPESYSSVSIADEQEAYRAVSELYKNGHRRIAVLTADPDDSSISQLRYLGYQRALRDFGLTEHPEDLICAEDFTIANAYAAMQKRLRSPADFTAVFAIADDMAIGAMRALRESGRSIPEDCSVIAIDGISVSEYIHPMLTTLCQPMTAMGEASVEILLDIIEGRGVHRHVTLPTALREGASVRQPKHRFSRGNPRENKFEKEY